MKVTLVAIAGVIVLNGCISFSARDLQTASMKGDAAQVSTLLEKGAKVDERIFNCSPFRNSYTEIIGSQCQITALMMASKYAHYSTVKLLLENGADINAEDAWNNTAIFYALAYLVKSKERILYSDYFFHNPDKIREPTTQEIERVVGLLINNGAILNKENILGLTPLMIATIGGNRGIEKLLCDGRGGLADQLKTPFLNLRRGLHLYVSLDGKTIATPVSQNGAYTYTPKNIPLSLGEHYLEVEYFYERIDQNKIKISEHGEKYRITFYAATGNFYDISFKIDRSEDTMSVPVNINERRGKWTVRIDEHEIRCR